MSVVEKQVFELIEQEPIPPIVIIGTGPVGIRVLQALLKRDQHSPIVMYGDEPWEPYNRVKLSLLLSGDTDIDGMRNTPDLPDDAKLIQHHNCAIVSINPEEKTVVDILGRIQRYSSLILATGSQPHIPSNLNAELYGVFTFRNMTDAQHLAARRVSSRRVVVIGGGLLGIEAARAMQRQNTEVLVVEHSPRLLNKQLDDEASEQLRENLLTSGMQVLLQQSVKEIVGVEKVEGMTLRSGRFIECDTIIISAGIKPNIELALNNGIAVGRGIRVNDCMQTSDPDIYAVGECAEHRQQIYGLVAPGLEQAEVAAHSILKGNSKYEGSITSVRLKVVGIPIFSMGEVSDTGANHEHVELVYRDKTKNIYRKLVLSRGRLIGAIAIGSGNETGRLQEAISKRRRMYPWQRTRFNKTGEIWPLDEAKSVSSWPASATVCHCMGVTRGQLTHAVNQGCHSITELKSATGASSVCGSCQPQLAQLLGSNVKIEPVRFNRVVFAISVLTALFISLFLSKELFPYSTSVATDFSLDKLWRDEDYKQISGFSILGLSVLGLFLSLQKRWKKITLGDYALWRVFHLVLGALIVILLLLHNGFRLGENLNMYMMLGFIGLMVMGSLAGGVIAVEHRIDHVLARRLRKGMIWGHILLFWPVPVLLTFHIIKSYYF